MKRKCKSSAPDRVTLLPSIFRDRLDVNRKYVMSLKDENLLQNFYLEAGMGNLRQLRNTTHGESGHGDEIHWGWESPTCQVRGHFLGHWLSAAARIFALTGDQRLKLKADHIVSELARCRKKNGSEWAGAIPEKYLHWTANGQPTWAPH